MKLHFTFILFLIASFSFLSGNVIAQNTLSNEITQSAFQQMNEDQQQVIVHNWMNQSAGVIIPEVFEKASYDFYTNRKGEENAYRKYAVVLRPIFNTALSFADKLTYCRYLLANFSENELPIELIAEQEKILKNQATK